MKIAAILVTLATACTTSGGGTSATAGPPPDPPTGGTVCCKHCGSGSKPCGDSCIAKSKQCHKTGGCACY